MAMEHQLNPSAVENERVIKQRMSPEDLYNLLAEEAAELAQAANKMVRVLRGTNPTPKSFEEVTENLAEEFADIILVAGLLGIEIDWFTVEYKLFRWRTRLENAQRMKGEWEDGE